MHKALGRGLESLLPSSMTQTQPQQHSTQDRAIVIDITKIKPNKYQPRKNFNEEKLKELSDSIKLHGLAQPVLVSPSEIPGEYELIAGERRLRASKMAGLKDIIAVVKKTDAKQKFQLAIIENIQRENLNPIEEAIAYKRLSDEFHHTQEELAQMLHKDRSVIANSMRLLNLPEDIRDAVAVGAISAGHGRILAGIDDEKKTRELAKRILVEKLTVREVEKIVSDWKTVISEKKKTAKPVETEIVNLAEDLQRSLGTKVKIIGKSKKGKIEIHYFSLSDLERLSAILKRSK
jgi:ParB family transcriptional regulator, chromosome partitioning protein